MEVVIIHHHLNPGGVTRIIESQIASLKSLNPEISIKVLVGETHHTFQVNETDVTVHINPILNYLTEIADDESLQQQYTEILTYLKSQISTSSIIHIHNPNLGKNPLVTLAIYQLAKEGYQLLNHAHDFAEDRPNNWDFLTEIISKSFGKKLAEVLYPKLPNYMLGVLNSFDYERLIKKGIDQKRVYLIPNPVSIAGGKDLKKSSVVKKRIIDTLSLDKAKQIITYPVRVIERKNIGEYILLSVLFADKANWLVTQPPKNPKELVGYKLWVAFCKSTNIAVHFEVGQKVGFEELISSTDLCFTTSQREGFGMAYMEPWIMNTPVMGRNLSYITNDLKERGIRFPYLYDSITIENEDFIKLDREAQMQVILSCLKKTDYKEQIIEDNTHLLNIFMPIDSSLIEHNKEIIRTGFSLKKYAEELYEIYERLVG